MHLSLAPSDGLPEMDLFEALAWAEQHDAVLRFNGNVEHAQHRSFRVSVHGHARGDRIIAVHPVPDDLPFVDTMVRAIADVRSTWEAGDRRRRLRLVPGGPEAAP